jgi:von Willebrand factor type A domain.
MDANFHGQAGRIRAGVQILLVFVAFLCLFVPFAMAQENCVSPERIQTLKSDITSQKPVQENAALKSEILGMKADFASRATQSTTDQQNPKNAVPNSAETGRKPVEIMCSILNVEPWPVSSTVGEDGASAWINLVKNYFSPQLQLDLVPIISAGVDQGQIRKDSELASLIDRLRLKAGQPQLFGTQAVIKDGFLVLSPLQSEERVDAWRSEYGMAPLSNYIRAMQFSYRKPFIRSTAKPSRVATSSPPQQKSNEPNLLIPGSDNDVVKIETSLVTVDVTVYGPTAVKLNKSDFKVYEDGKEQEISVFAAPESPFDIILLLDLSGSTAEKVGLIKKTTKRFVEMKRDTDRVAIVTFADSQTVVSPLEADKTKLLDSVSKIKDYGGSNIWDAEKFALDMLKKDSPAERRKAVVVMTDGVDNALTYQPGFGSKILFADLVEEVRNNSTEIFPIFLNTQGPDSRSDNIYADARRTLQLLANESGGNYYTTKDIGKLNEVYERVLKDVGQVYSLGYEPKNPKRDGSWRSIRVEISGHPDIKVKTRPGYYAK